MIDSDRMAVYLAFREQAPSHVRVAIRDCPWRSSLCEVHLTDERDGGESRMMFVDPTYRGWTLEFLAAGQLGRMEEHYGSGRERRFYRSQDIDMGEEYIG